MGWKICLALVKNSPYEDAPAIAQALDLQLEPNCIELERAFYPADRLSIGLFHGTALISYDKMAESLIGSKGGGDWETRLLRAFPQQDIMVAILHSVVNLAGYALFRQGKLLRHFWCSADDGIQLDVGEHWPQEVELFERSYLNSAGQRVIDDGGEECPFDCYGEELVFQLCQHFLGFRLDAAPEEFYQLPMRLSSAGAPATTSWWKRLLGRG